MTKTRIAVLVSMLLAVPAGVYALDQASSTEPSAEVPAQPNQEAVAVEQTTIVAAPVAVVNEPDATTVIAEPVAVERTITARAPSYTMASLQNPGGTFPQGSFDSEYYKPGTARQAAWLEQRDQQRQPMIASLGKGFPDGSANSENTTAPLPAQVAYFDRIEQQRLASMQPQRVARAIAVTPSATESSAQAGSAEVAMADTSPIR